MSDATVFNISVDLEIQVPGDKSKVTPDVILAEFFRRYRKIGDLKSSKVTASTCVVTKKKPAIQYDTRFTNRLHKYCNHKWDYNYDSYDTRIHFGFARHEGLNTIKLGVSVHCPNASDREIGKQNYPVLAIMPLKSIIAGQKQNAQIPPRKFKETIIVDKQLATLFGIQAALGYNMPTGTTFRNAIQSTFTVLEFILDIPTKKVQAVLTQSGIDFLKAANKPVPAITTVQMSEYDGKLFEGECQTIMTFLKDNFQVPVCAPGKEYTI